MEKVWKLKKQRHHNDRPLKFGLLWHHFPQFWSDLNTTSCTFGATPLSQLRESLKFTTKQRHFSELFQLWQRGDTHQLQRYDQRCGKLCHNRPNFTRLSLCYLGLNLNETSLRGQRGDKLYSRQSCSCRKKYPTDITKQRLTKTLLYCSMDQQSNFVDELEALSLPMLGLNTFLSSVDVTSDFGQGYLLYQGTIW